VKTIAFAATKGGTGKTTLCAGVATAITVFEPDAKVGIVDFDPQGSLTRWWNDRRMPPPLLLELTVPAVARALEQLRGAGLDWLFLDCLPGFISIARAAVASAHFVLVSTGPGALDLAAVASTVEMAAAACRFPPNRRSGVACAEPPSRPATAPGVKRFGRDLVGRRFPHQGKLPDTTF